MSLNVADAASCGLLHQFIAVTDTVLFNLSGLGALSGNASAVPLITRGLLLEDPYNQALLCCMPVLRRNRRRLTDSAT
jgi:hypothetical protein